MGRTKTHNPAPGSSSRVWKAHSSGIRKDAMKAVGVTLLAHAFLIMILGAILFEKVPPRPLQLVVRWMEEKEEAPPNAPEPLHRPSLRKPVRREIVKPIELPTSHISWDELALDSVSRIELPDLGLEPADAPRVYHSAAPVAKGGGTANREISARGNVPAHGWTGIRITMDLDSKLPRITGVVAGGPAHQQGVLGRTNYGDYLISVDGLSTANRALEEIRDLIIGQLDSMVSLGICKSPGSIVTVVSIRRGT